MYKLNNNVAWTDDIKNAFKHNITRARITYNTTPTSIRVLNESYNISDLTLTEERYISGVGFIGTATAKKLELNILNLDGTINLEDKNLSLEIGAEYNNSTYYINYGNFIVDSPPENDETTGKTKVVAYDYMIKFNKPYVDQVNYPCTLLQLLQNICSQAGVTLGTTDFANKNFSVVDNQFEGATLREVLQNIAKCAFSWARIGQDNKLYLDFSVTSSHTETFTIDDYKTNGFKKANEYYGPVNRIIYADSDIEGQEEKVEDTASISQNGLKELVIYDNLFAYTPEKRAELIQAGTRLLGLTYMPVSQLDSIGFIYLDCNDIINIETLDESTYTTKAFNHIIKYTGVTSDSFTAEGTSSNQDTYKNTATDAFQNQQTKIMVDRANKKIQSIASEIGDRSSKTTTLTQDVDGILAEVDNMVDYRREASGVTQLHIEDAGPYEIMELEIQGNKTYLTNLYPGTGLYPSENLYPNMEVTEF